MATKLVSFGYHWGKVPREENGTLVFDVRIRFRRNPHRLLKLRGQSGLSPAVAEDMEKGPGFAEAYTQLKGLVEKAPGEVWLGCTGGRHRSVYLAERIGRELGVPVSHRDIHRSRV